MQARSHAPRPFANDSGVPKIRSVTVSRISGPPARPHRSGVCAVPCGRFLGLQEFNHADAVKADPDVLISRDFKL
jgi:hypothetical protein